MDMDTKQLGAYISRARVGLGLAAMVAPGATLAVVVGGGANNAGARAVVRMLGIRDSVLGAGGSIVPANVTPSLLSVAKDLPGVYRDGCQLTFFDTSMRPCRWSLLRSRTSRRWACRSRSSTTTCTRSTSSRSTG